MIQSLTPSIAALTTAAALVFGGASCSSQSGTGRGEIPIRGIYGGIPQEVVEGGRLLEDYGVNAIFVGSNGIDRTKVELVKGQGALIFAEFNTLHVASLLEEFPDAAPVGPDGNISPPPHDWQGICPTHPGYRKNRMAEFRRLLETYPLDGIWLDYHHSHASWERDVPALPDTCFCDRCLRTFGRHVGVDLLYSDTPAAAEQLLGPERQRWIQWRCNVLTDWLREFRAIIDEVRPEALLGTFHCPWTDEDFGGARIEKLAIDLRAQAEFVDVFSPMPYHARFGHADDPEWISRQVRWLGEYLGLEGTAGERIRIWPIVQLSDWGEAVPAGQVFQVLEEGSRPPASGVMVFAWGSLRNDAAKVEALRQFYLGLDP